MIQNEKNRPNHVELLLQIPPASRIDFARKHLHPKYHAIAQHFKALPPSQYERTVLFVSIHPHTRETRLADAARLAGWDCLFLHQFPCRYEASRHFSYHARIEDLFQLILAMWLFPGAIIHVFALRGDHVLPLCATKNRPTIVDFYDTCSGFLSATPEEKENERKALLFADGITMRDLRVKYLQRLHGYVLPTERVFIHDPLPELLDPPLPTARPPDDPIRVVSVGWADGDEHSFLRISRIFCAAGIHVHLFLNPHQDVNHPSIAPYRNLHGDSPCFHLEPPAYGSDYIRLIRGYDFGLAISERFIFGEPSTSYTADYLRGCGSSRLADFIQHSLGVIVSPQFRFQHYWAKRYAQTMVPATRELMSDPEKILRAALAAKHLRDLAPITVQGVSQRLCRFYERIIATAQPISRHGLVPVRASARLLNLRNLI